MAFPVQLTQNGFPVSVENLEIYPKKIAHWDFSKLPVMTNGTKISILQDLSGFGNNLSNTVTSTQPTKAAKTNGLSIANFNGSQTIRSSVLGSSFPINTPYLAPISFTFVARFTTTQANQFPQLLKGSGTNGITILADNSTAINSGVVYAAGNALGTSQNGQSFLDNNFHVFTLNFGSTSSSIYVDGFLLSTNITGNLIAGGLLSPLIGDQGFTGDIAEIIICNELLNQDRINYSVQLLSDKWGITKPIAQAANGSSLYESGSTSDGSTYRIWAPANPIANAPLILWSHPQGQSEQIEPGYFAYPYVHACNALGWYFAASSLGTGSTPGGSASAWGNSSAQTALLNLYNLLSTRRTFNNVVLLGASMGSFTNALAVIKSTLPNIKASYFIDGAFSLLTMYKSATYYPGINLAYAIINGTLSAISTSGATSISSSVSFPTGSIILIDPFGTNPEQKTTGSPTGSGPYTIPLTTPLDFGHASGVAVSDYYTKTVNQDPMITTITNFTNLPTRFLASSTDVVTVQSSHTTPFKARLNGIATGNEIVQHKGGHLGAGSTYPLDFVTFIKTTLSI